MKKLLALLLSLSAANTFAQGNGKAILIACMQKLNAAKSISYYTQLQFKFFDYNDTNFRAGNVYELKVPADTVFGGYVWLAGDDTLFRFYNLDKIYVANKHNKTATVYKAHQNEQWAITGNISDRMLMKSFLEGQAFSRDTASGSTINRLADTTINNVPCYTLLIKYPDEDGFTGYENKMCIDKKTSLPVLRQSKVFFQGNCQYSSIYIKNLTLNTVSKSRFSATQLTGYTKKDYVSFPQSEKHPLLDSNSLAPIVTGKNYSKTLQPDIINYSGKITVLDFWYMECFPCVKAIPEIEKLHEKYKGKNVQFYGVNHIDNKEFNISKIPQFLQYNKMEYPTILIDADVTKSFKIIAWPTFYIIDEKGRIAYGTLGYEENMSDKMSPIIDKLLQSN